MRVIIILIVYLITTPVWAHEGHDDAPGIAQNTTPQQRIELSETTIKNLAIQTQPATLSPANQVIELNASIEYLPEAYANITSRANGTILKLMVQLGDTVTKGQPIAIFQPVFIGNAPVTLLAPASGSVVQVNVVTGQPVSSDTTIVAIADISKVLVKGIAFPTFNSRILKIGQPVRFSPVGDGKEYEGKIQRLSRSLEPQNRTYAIYALIDNPMPPLLENTTGKMSVQVATDAIALTIPDKAILGSLGDYFVFVREGNLFARRSVVVGERYGDRTEIVEGVLPDEDVVTVGNYQLQYAKSVTSVKDK